MGRKLQKILDVINEIALSLCELAMALMVLVIFMQIMSRTFIGSSFSWTEELARYLFIFLVVLGSGVALGTKSHIAVDLVYNRLGLRGRKILCIISFVLIVIMACILCVKGMELVSKTMVQKSPAMQVPMGYIYAMFPTAAALMILNVISYTVRFMTGAVTDPDLAERKGE